MVSLVINEQQYELNLDLQTPLLWVLRETFGLTGTKYCCGAGFCGVCTVHVDNVAARSCSVPLSAVEGKTITTIEGLAKNVNHPLIKAWIAEQVTQCGYCQPGQVMTAAALLKQNPAPSDEDIDAAMSGVLCRCGTYQRIRRAIRHAANIQVLQDE
jgi:isoquinoline 1-oxidoreductase alpha subunit